MRARLCAPAGVAERRAGYVLLAAFGVGSIALAATAGAGSGWVAAFIVLAGIYAVAGLVEFEVGAIHLLQPGRTGGNADGPAACRDPIVRRGRGDPRRARQRRTRITARDTDCARGGAVSLPVVAPAAVLASATPVSSWTDWPTLVCALAAYVAADLLSSKIFARLAYRERLVGRRWPTHRSTPSICCSRHSVWRWRSRRPDANGRCSSCSCPSRCFWVFANERRTRIDHALELSRAYRGTAMLLGDVVETDDAYTGSHSRDVGRARRGSRPADGP